MDLRTEDIAAALRAAAVVLSRKEPMSAALNAAAETFEKRQAIMTAAGRAVRSEKALGDVVIGSVCVHDWRNDMLQKFARCVKCGETHADDCPALLGDKCTCEPGNSNGV